MSETTTEDPREAEPKPRFPRQTQEHPGEEHRMRPRPDYGENSYVGHGRLEGKVALVTGGDSGIGRAVALAFAREGADVAISYLNEHEDAKEIQGVIARSGRTAMLMPGDLADPAHCRRLVDSTVSKLGRLDILVNNAAHQGDEMKSLEELDTERLERTFRVNILAMFHLVRAALPHLQPGASIVNVASIQAYDPSPGIVDYATTKGAIVTLTKALSKELLERGIRVNAVAPGPVWTPLIAQSFDAGKVAQFGKQSPMGRPAQPVELAPAFVFLVSDEGRYVNGEVLGVTGGMLMP